MGWHDRSQLQTVPRGVRGMFYFQLVELFSDRIGLKTATCR